MSITRAMYAGVSGLMSEGRALGVVGDNVANVNTVGYKQSRAIFADVLGGAVGVPAGGAGVRMVRAQQIFAQGTLTTTGEPLDVALSGNGFLVAKGTVEGVAGQFFTRAGQLVLRADGAIATQGGLEVQGYAADGSGAISSTLGGLKLANGALPPRATTGLKLTANLDATAASPALPFDPQNPGVTSNLSTSMTVYDSLGAPHTVDIHLRKTAVGAWEYHALAKGSEVVGGVAGTNVDIASGTLAFTPTGALQSIAPLAGGTVSFNGATPAQALALDFGVPIAAGGTGTSGLTQYGAPSSISAQSQDGYASGALAGVKIESDGTVKGVYTNGQSVAAGRLALATFQSTDGLARAGNSFWAATRDSGEAAVGVAGSDGRASINSGALEQSNVDISQQFVELISHQRAFQANSKTITTADEMLQEVLTIKR
jgi:flagellar hook protein FlgE